MILKRDAFDCVARAGRRSGRIARGKRTGFIATGKPPRAAACPCHTQVVSILFLFLLLIGCGDNRETTTPPTPPPVPPSPLQRGVDFLLSKQAADGGWHSETYGQLKGGAANTALIVYALAHLPADQRKPIQPQIDRAIAFLLNGIDEQGYIRHADKSADYPTYATAMLVTALHRMEMTAAHKSAIKRMVDYLKRSQQTTRQGWKESDPDYGGWNQTGGEPPDARIEGQTNIAITSIVLEALQAAGALNDDVKVMALDYVSRCQNFGLPGDDSGFKFNPRADHFLNKAGFVKLGDAAFARSYGTATADGISAMLACGAAADNPRLFGALRWTFFSGKTVSVPYGKAGDVPGPSDTDFTEGLRFYYAFALARVARVTTPAEAVRMKDVRDQLTRDQQPDGSWRNANTMMREDDPLIATAMAVAALAMTR